MSWGYFCCNRDALPVTCTHGFFWSEWDRCLSLGIEQSVVFWHGSNDPCPNPPNPDILLLRQFRFLDHGPQIRSIMHRGRPIWLSFVLCECSAVLVSISVTLALSNLNQPQCDISICKCWMCIPPIEALPCRYRLWDSFLSHSVNGFLTPWISESATSSFLDKIWSQFPQSCSCCIAFVHFWWISWFLRCGVRSECRWELWVYSLRIPSKKVVVSDLAGM